MTQGRKTAPASSSSRPKSGRARAIKAMLGLTITIVSIFVYRSGPSPSGQSLDGAQSETTAGSVSTVEASAAAPTQAPIQNSAPPEVRNPAAEAIVRESDRKPAAVPRPEMAFGDSRGAPTAPIVEERGSDAFQNQDGENAQMDTGAITPTQSEITPEMIAAQDQKTSTWTPDEVH